MGEGPQDVTHGVLLPGDATRPRSAAGRWRARRRRLELRRRESQAPPRTEQAPRHIRTSTMSAGCDDRRCAGARTYAVRRRLWRSGALLLRSHARGSRSLLRPLRRNLSTVVRRFPGRHGDRRGLCLSLGHLDVHQHRPARSPRLLPPGRGGVARRPCPTECRGGFHPSDSRLARVHSRRLLAAHAGLRVRERARGRSFIAGVLLDRRYADALRRRGRAHDAPARLRTPYPASDGHRQFCADSRHPTAGGRRLVPRRVRGRVRVG